MGLLPWLQAEHPGKHTAAFCWGSWGVEGEVKPQPLQVTAATPARWAGPGTDELPSCGGSGLFLSRVAHPGGVFPSNNALFLHPAISAKECAVCVSSRKLKTPIMVSCPAASSSHSFI